MIDIIRTNSADKSFLLLIAQLNSDLALRNGEIQNMYNQYNFIESIDTVIIATDNKVAVACGCFKIFNNDTVEIKRMYVEKEYRGKGISKKVLGRLEEWAKELGYKKSILETGIYQMEAIGLYEKSGYIRIPNYGQYAGMDTSVCMMKQLVNENLED
jgi:putative acetyltransferase